MNGIHRKRWCWGLFLGVWLGAGHAQGIEPAGPYSYTNSPEVIERPVMRWGERTDDAGTNRLCVGTYNIQDFTDGAGDGKSRNWEVARRHAAQAAAMVNRMQADLLVLQEIENETALQMLNDALEEPYPLAVVTDLGTGEPGGNDQKLNLAALSRREIHRAMELDFGPLRGQGRPTRGLLRLELALDEARSLVIYAVHLKSNHGRDKGRNRAQRSNAMAILRDDFKALSESMPGRTWEVMVAGDTNVDPELKEFSSDPSLAPLAGWRDLWRGTPIEERTTVPTRYGDRRFEFPPACFDRVFASAELDEAPWKVGAPRAIPGGVLTENVNALPGLTEHVSDHYPVVVEIER